MKKFEISFASHVTVEAADFEEARKKFTEQHPIPIAATLFTDLETHEERAVLGYCEISDLPIFEEEEYESDSEGVMWLKREDADDIKK